MANQHITIKGGAREHNLKNVDLKIPPREKLVVFTGLSVRVNHH